MAHFAMFLPVFVQISCLGAILCVIPYVYSLYNTYKGLKIPIKEALKEARAPGLWRYYGFVAHYTGLLWAIMGVCI